MILSFDDVLLMISATAALSVKNKILWLASNGPQISSAQTIGNSSLTVICSSFIVTGHSPATHLLPKTAANPPCTPAASEKSFMTSEETQSLNRKQDLPL